MPVLGRILVRMRRGGHWGMVIPDPEVGPIKRKTVRRVARTFTPYKGKVGLVAVTIFITSVLGIVNPILIKVIFDRALFGNPPGDCGGFHCPRLGPLYLYVGIMIAVPIVSGIIGMGQTYLANVVGLRVMQDLRNSLYAHLQRMALRFFTNTRTGEIQSRLANDVGGIQEVVTDTASSILANVVIVVSTLIAMLLMSWQLTALSLFMMPFFLWLTYKVGKARQEVARNTQKTLADVTAITEETLSVSGILLSKAFGRQRFEIDRFRRENERLAGLQIRQQMIGRSFFAVIQIFFSITPALVYLVAGWVISGGGKGFGGTAITAGTIVAFTTLQSRLFFPIGQMLQVSVEVQASMALFDRIFEYLDMPHEVTDSPGAVELPASDTQGRVRFRDVWFRYDASPFSSEEAAGTPVSPPDAVAAMAQNQPPEFAAQALAADQEAARDWTLQGVDIEIEPGQLAALVGPSGAGKTTMTYLVPRFYDVQRGEVEIDGVPVRRIALASLGDIIGMVTQETYLFHDTIRRNLLYGNPDASEDDLRAAARAAFIDDRISELAEGFDTVVGERGYKLSG